MQYAIPDDAQQAYFASKRRANGLRFVRRVYPTRVIGLALAGIAVATVFWTERSSLGLWFALWTGALAWPHFAYGLGVNSADPFRTELRCLMVDSALGGAFIALMKFNLLPGALFVAMLSMDKLAIGGVRFLVPCSAALVGSCLAVAAATGFAVRTQTMPVEVYGCLPLLLVYPLLVGFTSYRMARQLRYQNKQLEAMSAAEGLGRMLARPAWERMVAEEFELCRHNALPSALVLVGIDDLPRLNHRHGYPKGDEVIRSIAVTMRNALREQDVPGRLGGGEFGALLSGSDAARAMQVAERIRRAVDSEAVEQQDELRCSVSVGVAALEAGDRGYRDWMLAAERAVRAARDKGGNRVEPREAD